MLGAKHVSTIVYFTHNWLVLGLVERMTSWVGCWSPCVALGETVQVHLCTLLTKYLSFLVDMTALVVSDRSRVEFCRPRRSARFGSVNVRVLQWYSYSTGTFVGGPPCDVSVVVSIPTIQWRSRLTD